MKNVKKVANEIVKKAEPRTLEETMNASLQNFSKKIL